jgi:hypothetical protein
VAIAVQERHGVGSNAVNNNNNNNNNNNKEQSNKAHSNNMPFNTRQSVKAQHCSRLKPAHTIPITVRMFGRHRCQHTCKHITMPVLAAAAATTTTVGIPLHRSSAPAHCPEQCHRFGVGYPHWVCCQRAYCGDWQRACNCCSTSSRGMLALCSVQHQLLLRQSRRQQAIKVRCCCS